MDTVQRQSYDGTRNTGSFHRWVRCPAPNGPRIVLPEGRVHLAKDTFYPCAPQLSSRLSTGFLYSVLSSRHYHLVNLGISLFYASNWWEIAQGESDTFLVARMYSWRLAQPPNFIQGKLPCSSSFRPCVYSLPRPGRGQKLCLEYVVCSPCAPSSNHRGPSVTLDQL